MKKSTIHISWDEITNTLVKLFRGIPIDLGHAEDASMAISRMEAWSKTGLQYIYDIYDEISPKSHLGVKFLIKRPHLLVVDANNQTIFKILEVVDLTKVYAEKYGYLACYIHNFKHEKVFPALLYKNHIGNIQLSAQIISANILSAIQNVETRNNPKISEYSIPNHMVSEGMITLYAYDSNYFDSFNFRPMNLPSCTLSPSTLQSKLSSAQMKGLIVDEQIWNWVVEQSKKILVPESDRSKSQAG